MLEYQEICKICNKEFNLELEFNRHPYKIHGINLKTYYEKIFDRRDKLTGEKIEYKNKEQYFSVDFLTKTNLKKWLKKQDIETQKDYCKELLTRRKEKKSLVFAPCQVELRSLSNIPPVSFYQELFGDYYKLCEELGFKNRFANITAPKSQELKDVCVIVDSREQKPIIPDLDFQVGKLDYGDYTLSKPELCGNIYIERKTLQDFAGTISQGYERFENEIVRAKNALAYLIVLVEAPFSSVMGIEYLPWFKRVTNSKITGEFLFHRIRELLQKHDNLQFLFVKDRAEFVETLKKIFFTGGFFKTVDAQLLYDKKLL